MRIELPKMPYYNMPTISFRQRYSQIDIYSYYMRMRVPYIIIKKGAYAIMSKQEQPITKAKLDLIEKIIKARLTKDELQSVTDKAKSILAKRS